MELDYWLFVNKVSRAKMGKDVGVHPQTIYMSVIKKCTPSLFTALSINKYTNGDVSLPELLSVKDTEKYNKLVGKKEED